MATNDFVVIGHRGNPTKCPENTIASFECAVETGPAFELDVQTTSDGVVVVFHNENLNKTTNGQGLVAATEWAYIQQLDAGSWFSDSFSDCHVPKLAEVLNCFRLRAHIHLELKSTQPRLANAVKCELEKSGWLADLQQADASHCHAASHRLSCVPGLTITSFHLDQLQKSIELLPGVQHGWLIQEITEPVLQAAKAAGVNHICPRVNACSKELVDMALAAGFPSVRGWGVKSKELLLHAVACGMHGATVDWPHEAVDLIVNK